MIDTKELIENVKYHNIHQDNSSTYSSLDNETLLSFLRT